MPELGGRWLAVSVEESASTATSSPSLLFSGYDPVEGRAYSAVVTPSTWAEPLGVGPLTSLTTEQKLVLCRSLW